MLIHFDPKFSSVSELLILIPVYNDWKSLEILIKDISKTLPKEIAAKTSLVIVDDCSTIETEIKQPLFPLHIIRLSRNMGHQKAIAIGLAYIADNMPSEAVIVMDADGEDKPEGIEALWREHLRSPYDIIFAERTKRHEGFLFKSFYIIYKALFKILTGKSISFGNFCIIPSIALHKVVRLSEIWNHFSGGIIKSRLAYQTIPLERGIRLSGSSKMNLVSLVMHGLSAVAVHVDTVAIRILLGTGILIILTLTGIVTVAVLRFFTNMAIPGWATTAFLGLAIILMQLFMISLLLSFMVLSYRSRKLIIPKKDYKDFIQLIETHPVNELTNV